MVECWSPKPKVEGSSPSLPALIKVKKYRKEPSPNKLEILLFFFTCVFFSMTSMLMKKKSYN